MAKPDIVATGPGVEASTDGRRLTLDPIRVIPITVEIREVESTIPCGFRQMWGEVDIDGDVLQVTSGAGVGSEWATIQFRGKDYCFAISDVVASFVEALDATSGR